jgi:cell wall-associated NlpC family hydrolase
MMRRRGTRSRLKLTRTLLTETALVAVLTGCTVTAPTTRGTEPAIGEGTALVAPSAVERERLLRAEAERWSGTPHRLGGTDARGIDCSALVQSVYREAFGTDVPRTTERQVLIGEPVPQQALTTGDLVFFRPTKRTRHVGIYLSNGEFLHVSRSMGVAVSSLSDPYWSARYWTTRRVLPPAEQIEPTKAAISPLEPVPTPPRRNGW